MTRVAGEEIELEYGSTRFAALRVAPRGSAAPGVVVVHEGFGLDAAVRETCERLGREGFLALAPDLLDGRTTHEASVAEGRVSALDRADAVSRLAVALEHTRRDAVFSGPRPAIYAVGAAGALALEAASQHPESAGPVVAICALPNPDEIARIDAGALRGPVLVVVGERDPAVEGGGLARLELRFRRGSADLHVQRIKEAGAHFASGSRPDAFDAAAATATWDATLAFLRATA